MRYSLFIAIVAFVMMAGCREEQVESGPKQPVFQEYTLEKSEPGLYSVTIRYQRIANTEESDILQSIDLANYATTFDGYVVEPADVEASAHLMATDYSAQFADFQHFDSPWYSLDQEAFTARDGRIVCFETQVSIYTGGAHGGHTLIYECYDLNSGQLYDFSYLLEGEWAEAVRTLLYERLLLEEDYLIIASAEELHIPHSVLITEEGLTFVYQPYEIAAFSEGIISVELTDEEIEATGAPLVWMI